MNKKTKLFGLTVFEICLWSVSMAVMIAGFFLSPNKDPINLAASCMGVTALIFLAKGAPIGQVFIIIFAILYAWVSFEEKYYGEMITYLGMTAPMAVLALISWIRHPFGDSGEVEVVSVGIKKGAAVVLLTAIVTFAFYFILKALGNASLIVSTISVATSFFAASLTFLRSPYYAIGYALNDIVLIILWAVSAAKDPASFVMVACFVMFLVNDLYGFISWRRMKNRQKGLAL